MTGKDIRKFLDDRGVTITAFANITGIRREDIHRFLNGIPVPDVEAAKISGVMDKLYNYKIKENA